MQRPLSQNSDQTFLSKLPENTRKAVQETKA
jgi:hypothetical protein